MHDPWTASEAARELSKRLGRFIPPRTISDLLYTGKVDDNLCPLVGGRRLITADGLSAIEALLRQRFEAPVPEGD
jgi:hypothetical protein